MTLLSAQLLRLRQDTSSVLDVDKRKRASILFQPEEAAKVSYDVVLQLAQPGIWKQPENRICRSKIEI